MKNANAPTYQDAIRIAAAQAKATEWRVASDEVVSLIGLMFRVDPGVVRSHINGAVESLNREEHEAERADRIRSIRSEVASLSETEAADLHKEVAGRYVRVW